MRTGYLARTSHGINASYIKLRIGSWPLTMHCKKRVLLQCLSTAIFLSSSLMNCPKYKKRNIWSCAPILNTAVALNTLFVHSQNVALPILSARSAASNYRFMRSWQAHLICGPSAAPHIWTLGSGCHSYDFAYFYNRWRQFKITFISLCHEIQSLPLTHLQ